MASASGVATGTANGLNLIRPVGGFKSSPFGMRGGVLHAGVDLAVGKGTPIHAAAGGKVIRSSWFDGYGYCVDIQHAGGVMTRYAHQVRQPPVSVGQVVSQGQVIGYVGSTGDSSGNHLHFEVRLNGKAVDPWPYINGKSVPTTGEATAVNVGITNPVGYIADASKFAKIITDEDSWARGSWIILGSLFLIFGLVFVMGGSVAHTFRRVRG